MRKNKFAEESLKFSHNLAVELVQDRKKVAEYPRSTPVRSIYTVPNHEVHRKAESINTVCIWFVG